ncbi:MAG: hypothetical protein M0006_08665 [Magnetospirillum sp.]|nr:hypothetical protein [Magnetospirillum sp.]
MDVQKVLIIKTGYSETLDPDVSGTVSLGDVLRTTVLLHLFPAHRYHVTWLTDGQAWPLLRGNTHIHRVIKVNPFTPFQLMRGYYDIIINLEKDPGLCALADSIPGWQRFGFRFDPRNDETAGHLQSEEAFWIANDPQFKQRLGRNWSQVLFEMMGETWKGERCLLGHYPANPPAFDIGLNYRIGNKFPLKGWPSDSWKELAARCERSGLSVTWQPEQDNVDEIEKYIDWVGSCRVLVTTDSLGMHIAEALRKPVVALFGPTSHTDIPDDPQLVKLKSAGTAGCQPCRARDCQKGKPCMPLIPVGQVFSAVEEMMRKVGSLPDVSTPRDDVARDRAAAAAS